MNKKFPLSDIFFFLMLIGLTVAFYKIIQPFLIDIFLSILIARYSWPMFQFFCKRLKASEGLSALISVLIAMMAIILPLIFIVFIVSQETITQYAHLKGAWPAINQKIHAALPELQKNPNMKYIKPLTETISKADVQSKLNEFAGAAAQFGIKILENTVINVNSIIFHFFLIIFIVYYFLLDGKAFLKKMHYLLPLNDEDEKELITEFNKITDGTLLGTLMIGAIEGIFGATLFVIFHLSSPIFWGIMILLVSILPMIGSAAIYFPACFILFFLGHKLAAIIFIILCIVGSNIIQNIIKPKLLGKSAGLHPAIMLLTTFGGIFWFGLLGFIIGPLFGALCVAIWNQYGRHYKEELTNWNKS